MSFFILLLVLFDGIAVLEGYFNRVYSTAGVVVASNNPRHLRTMITPIAIGALKKEWVVSEQILSSDVYTRAVNGSRLFFDGRRGELVGGGGG